MSIFINLITRKQNAIRRIEQVFNPFPDCFIFRINSLDLLKRFFKDKVILPLYMALCNIRSLVVRKSKNKLLILIRYGMDGKVFVINQCADLFRKTYRLLVRFKLIVNPLFRLYFTFHAVKKYITGWFFTHRLNFGIECCDRFVYQFLNILHYVLISISLEKIILCFRLAYFPYKNTHRKEGIGECSVN